MVGKKTWTDDEEQLLIDLTKEGLPLREVSDCLGRSIYSIRSKRNRMKIASRPAKRWTTDEHALLKELYVSRGLSIEEIARRLDRSSTGVEVKARKLHLRRPHTAAQLGFRLGAEFFKESGIEIVSMGDTTTAEDFIILHKGEETLVNVKVGDYMNVTKRNFTRLKRRGMPIHFLWFRKNGDIVRMEVTSICRSP